MPLAASYNPDPEFVTLGPEFSDPVAAAVFPNPQLRFRNDHAAAEIGLDTLDEAEWLSAFLRFEPLARNQPAPLAMRYHGHQFGTYNPDLGDGRGFLYAQVRDAGGRLLDLGTKGTGRTPWSRQGDGRLTLKGGFREVLATSMLEAQGAPTSRSLSLFETGDALERNDEPSPTRGAVLTRLSYSHIRFGTFQRLAYLGRSELIEQLLDHVVRLYYPDAAALSGAPRVVALLQAVVERTAKMTARWMAAGFVHGVLNTDNMNINGESFDYGPYRFLPFSDPNFVAAYFDEGGRYAFAQQPTASFWNLQQLAGCLTEVAAAETLVEPLNTFADHYRRHLVEAMLERFGLRPLGDHRDAEFVGEAFTALAAGGPGLRWEPLFHDWFGGPAGLRAGQGPRAALYATPAFTAFRDKISAFEPNAPDRLSAACLQTDEPCELLIGEVEALWSRISQEDDWTPFSDKVSELWTLRCARYGAPAEASLRRA